ncbi:ABC transporter permease [Xylanimonas allomyrinae]|uniref:ABC transporter permease n=1 Tax=Xylanimonas allomyrinae TaxID=2509459 RepID=A0A4P6ER38_9MICO|nr:ABC transporter permease [Xylanimonas allomyrinae]QAY62807.1 ABC transporter permease [Xylanimonas allomyrinae]
MTETLVRAVAGVALLVVITATVLWWARVPRPWAPGKAVLRGTLQLAAISLVLRGVIGDARWVALAMTVMFAVASITVARRLGLGPSRAVPVVAAMGVGVAVALGTAFGTGAIDATPRYTLALGGIVIGGSMTTATLAGRRLASSLRLRWAEVEAWLALGATRRQATAVIARESVAEALVPAIDQTRTTGLVTLPGAFVGAIFGGASPVEAGRFQIVVLAAILAAGAVTAVLLLTAIAPTPTRPMAPPG